MAAPKRKAPPKANNTPEGKTRRTGRTKKAVENETKDSFVPDSQDETDVNTQVQELDSDSSQDVLTVSPLTPEQLLHFRDLLRRRRREILGDVDIMSGGDGRGNRQDNSGDLSSMPIHMADIGTDNYEQEFTLGLIESDRRQLEDIDRALVKIAQGEYGICEGTGKPINLARLEAKPEARYCIEFARQLEKGLVRTPGEDSIRHDDDDHDDDENDD